MNIETVSFLNTNANKLSLDSPLYITQIGKEVYVIQDAADFRRQHETIALLKLINLSGSRLSKDGEISLNEAFDV